MTALDIPGNRETVQETSRLQLVDTGPKAARVSVFVEPSATELQVWTSNRCAEVTP